MICDVISSGSHGNAVLLENEILIDCGVPYKLLKPYVKDLRLVLLTHAHGDHFNPTTIRRLHQERPTLRFGCCEWMVRHLLEAGVSPKVIDIYAPLFGSVYAYARSRILVSAFPLFHDVENCGYKITVGRKTALYATDTSTIGISAPGLDLYMIEANHTEKEIAERIRKKLENGQYIYERRVEATHLSRESADAWLAMNAGPDSKVIYLHQHKEPDNERS